MPVTFAFALSQQQTFELRCDYGSRRLDQVELLALIEQCEQNYYSQESDRLSYLTEIGRQLYSWLDGKEGWLRNALDETDEQTIYLDLIQTSEAQGLNPETERVALGLAHLPWELLRDRTGFLLQRQDIAVLPVRSVQQRNTKVAEVANRPLRLLFMATSPEHPGIAPLQFEQEEANILTATKEQPLALIVEESGSVAELTNLVQSYSPDYFDVFHLTGHGVIFTEEDFGGYLPENTKIKDYTPCFITEDEVGNVQFTTVEDLAKAFKKRFPRVVFLSGCHTGQVANKGTVPSMAQALVKAGAAMVLGWARPVYDRTGIIAAKAFYQALATGATVEDAVKAAQGEMISQRCSDWHLLRIYRDNRPIAELVTPLNFKKREKLKFTPSESEFLDENNIVKVASRGEFVGRRRALQRCLRALRQTSDNIGVFIAGMGGLGKSSLAARLCTRVQSQRPNFERVVLIGPVDEVGLINKLASKFERFEGVPALLNQPGISFKGRLQNFFEAIEDTHDKPLLLVLDDFEQNIPQGNIEDGSLRMTAEAYGVLEALCAALAENQAESRLIVTCRYLKADTLPRHSLHLESLAAMNPADVDKICRDLEKEVKQQVHEQRIITIADGNPRLLKWLLDVVKKPGLAADELLTKLEATQQEFREDILAETLLKALNEDERKFLARLSVFRLPVREDVVKAATSTDTAWESNSQANSESPLKRTEDFAQTISSSSMSDITARESNSQANSESPLKTTEDLAQTISSSSMSDVTARESNSQANSESPLKRTEDLAEKISSPLERTSAMSQEINFLAVMTKLVSLSLVESATIYANQTATYRVATILELLLQPVLSEAEWQTTRQQAARNLYKVWWEESEESTEAEALEIVRLGLLADEQEIAVSVGDNIARSWVNSSRFMEAVQLCQQLMQYVDYRILGTIARAEVVLGIEDALAHYQQALDLCPEEDLKNKAAILHNMAYLIAQRGDIDGAIALYQQSLEITERINDVEAKAATLSNMAYLIAQRGDIEGAIALYQQSLEITERINDVEAKAATLHAMAYLIAQRGDIEGAIALYQQSLEITERINDVKVKAATLHEMAGLIAQSGDIEGAIALYQQSLEITERINDVKVKAASLHQMAYLIAQRGDIEGAIALYQQSLEINERINDVKGKAATLSNMAKIAFEKGDIQQTLELLKKSATALGQARAYIDLVIVLHNLGVADESNSLVYLAQATWLTLKIQAPLTDTIQLIGVLYNAVPQGDEIEALLGTTALFFCNRRGENHPQLEELQERSFTMISAAADAQGIETQEAFDTWFVQQRLNDSEYYIPRSLQRLEEIVGDGWLFERF
jgi:tetratricopeptide (TPR) repeat protein